MLRQNVRESHTTNNVAERALESHDESFSVDTAKRYAPVDHILDSADWDKSQWNDRICRS